MESTHSAPPVSLHPNDAANLLEVASRAHSFMSYELRDVVDPQVFADAMTATAEFYGRMAKAMSTYDADDHDHTLLPHCGHVPPCELSAPTSCGVAQVGQ